MAKYDSMRKTGRNQAIVQMHKEHPELSMNEIAHQFGVSRNRVSQILKRDGNKPA